MQCCRAFESVPMWENKHSKSHSPKVTVPCQFRTIEVDSESFFSYDGTEREWYTVRQSTAAHVSSALHCMYALSM